MADGAPQGGTDLGRRIREYRERAGLSQEEAAARVGMAGYLGFQVRRTGCDPYAQVRMAGRIAGFDRRARPRCGRVHRGCCARCGRPRASWDGVLRSVVAQATAAGRVAATQWGLDVAFCPGHGYMD